MFSVTYHEEMGVKILRLNQEGKGYIDIIPELGGAVHQIALPDPETSDPVELIASDSGLELLENPWFRGRHLFPFNDRIPEGKYTFDGAEYQLPLNWDNGESSIHGLIYNRPMETVFSKSGLDGAEVVLLAEIKEQNFECYPFQVSLYVTYRLNSLGFSIEFKTVNTGDKNAPIALGWHPYFKLGDSINDCTLTAGGGRYIPVGEDMNPTGDVEPVEGTEFDYTKGIKVDNTEVDIAVTTAENGIALLAKENRVIEFYFDPEMFPYTQLFIPPDRKSIAIEPITAATNAFNMPEMGLRVLKPGDEVKGLVKITLNKI